MLPFTFTFNYHINSKPEGLAPCAVKTVATTLAWVYITKVNVDFQHLPLSLIGPQSDARSLLRAS